MASFQDVNPYATGAIRELDSLAVFCGLDPSACPSEVYGQTITDRWVLAWMTVGLGGAGKCRSGRGDEEVGPGDPLAAREQPVAQEDLDGLSCRRRWGVRLGLSTAVGTAQPWVIYASAW